MNTIRSTYDTSNGQVGTSFPGRFQGRVAIVTGGASGIGAGAVRRLAAEGARVVIVDVNRELAEEVSGDMVAAGHHVEAVACDVASDVEVRKTVADILERHGRMDILVNVAGGTSADRLAADAMPAAEFDRVLGLNLGGTYHFIHHVLPIMVRQAYGRIVNITSTAALVTSDRTTPAYASAKAAVIGLTRQLVFDYGRHGITANAIAPGHIITPIALRKGAERLRSRISMIPAGRLGQPEDIAAAICFLASDEASFVNGQTLVVDGGQTSVMNYADSLDGQR